MFEGKAGEAMKFYVSLFPGATLDELVPNGPKGPGKQGKCLKGRLPWPGSA
jgi:predicted 3-demethylubiquinone-9 3-methyltransferase (glyoxalase superfamily)